MIYQEQLMRASQKLAGYSLEEADNLRKAPARRSASSSQGALEVRRRLRRATAHAASSPSAIFDTIEPFADYSFNKSHRVGYGYITYQTAWLKANYPVQYLAALLTSVKSEPRQGRVLPQRVPPARHPGARSRRQRVASDFVVRARATSARGRDPLRPLGGAQRRRGCRELIVAGARERAVRRLLRLLRARRPAVLNKRTIESLIKAAASTRSAIRARAAARVRADRRRDARGAGASATRDDEPVRPRRRRARRQPGVRRPPPIPDVEFDKSRRCGPRRRCSGLYVSDHPLMGAEAALRRHVECTIAELAELDDGAMRNVAGVVTALQRKYTKRGDLMATFVLEDLAAAIEVMVFPKTMLQYGELLDADAIVVVKAPRRRRDDTTKLIGDGDRAPRDAPRRRAAADAAGQGRRLDDDRVAKLRELLRRAPGRQPVFVRVVGAEKETVLAPRRRVQLAKPETALYAELRVLFGADCIA
jgi:DNA polymerase-3 subunit alpha